MVRFCFDFLTNHDSIQYLKFDGEFKDPFLTVGVVKTPSELGSAPEVRLLAPLVAWRLCANC
jgi:hypothetical protein